MSPRIIVLLIFALLLSTFSATTQANSELQVKCNVSRATIWLDGKSQGFCPAKLSLAAGRHWLMIEKIVDKDVSFHYQSALNLVNNVSETVTAVLVKEYANTEEGRRRKAEQEVLDTLQPGMVFKDCPHCPSMVVIPEGSFMMGSPESESGGADNEGPLHRVTLGKFSLGKFEVTVGEFRRFVKATQYQTDAELNQGDVSGCYAWDGSDGKFAWRQGIYWENPGFTQTDRQPVVCVSWNDAVAYVKWLSQLTGKRYHLPSESEWEYAARGNTSTSRYWGEDPDDACRYANVADLTRGQGEIEWPTRHECSDGYFYTAPVGSYRPNAFGLFDMIGNVWEWTADNWHENYSGAPGNGSVWTSSATGYVIRGGSWYNSPLNVRIAKRDSNDAAFRFNNSGFRVARVLP